VKPFDLKQLLEEDSANVHKQISASKPFYKTVFPEMEL
jgi:hypothetical protein